MKNTYSLLIAVLLISSTASATTVANLNQTDLIEAQGFADALANHPEMVISQGEANEGTPEGTRIVMGHIRNSRTLETIDIYCTIGTREECNEISFFVSYGGVSEAQVLKRLTSLNQISALKFHFPQASAWSLDHNLNGTEYLPPVTAAVVTCIVVDAITTPIRLIFLNTGAYRRAKEALLKALNNASTVDIPNRQYKIFKKQLMKS